MKVLIVILSILQVSTGLQSDDNCRTSTDNKNAVYALLGSTASLDCSKEPTTWTLTNQQREKEDVIVGLVINSNLSGHNRINFTENGLHFKIYNLTENDTGKYCCEFKQEEQATEECIRLETIDIHVSSAIRNHTVSGNSGENITLSCSTPNNITVSSISWIYNGTREKTPFENYTMKLSRKCHKDIITCEAYVSCTDVVLRQHFTLDVMYEPKVKIMTNPSNSPKEGDNVTLVCSVDSNPENLTVKWTKDSKILSTSPTLVIPNFREDRNGLYNCTAQNTVGLVQVVVKPSTGGSRIMTTEIGIYILGCSTLVIIVLLMTVIYMLFRKRADTEKLKSSTDRSHYTKADSTQEKVWVEIGYEEVAFNQGKGVKRFQNKRETVFEEVVFNPTASDKRFTIASGVI